jgi:putative oligomerization/nucleic acid binding protein
MPGLLRGMARTAVVAGTATAVSNRVSRRQANKWAQQGQEYAPVQRVGYTNQDQPQEQYAPPPPAAPAADPVQQLKDLADLKNQGILTEEEFAAQKAKILAQT